MLTRRRRPANGESCLPLLIRFWRLCALPFSPPHAFSYKARYEPLPTLPGEPWLSAEVRKHLKDALAFALDIERAPD